MHPPSDPFIAALHDWIETFMRRSMRNFILYSKDSGLSMSQIGALFHIQRQGSCGVSDIGESLGVTPAAASQMLERLVQLELIQRSEDPQDRRVKLIVLTDTGRQTLKDSLHARQGWLGDLSHSLPEDEKACVIQALHILTERTKKLKQHSE